MGERKEKSEGSISCCRVGKTLDGAKKKSSWKDFYQVDFLQSRIFYKVGFKQIGIFTKWIFLQSGIFTKCALNKVDFLQSGFYTKWIFYKGEFKWNRFEEKK